MSKLYKLEIDLSSADGALPRTGGEDWMRVRLYGHSVPRRVMTAPTAFGSVYFKNDGEEVTLTHGPAVPVRVPAGACIHVMFDGSPGGMFRVEG